MNIGVKYISSAKNPSGYGEAARNFITALFVSGINITTESIAQMVENTHYGLNSSIINHLEGRNIPYKVKLIHLTPDLYPTYMESGKYNIGHLFWECDKLPREWIEPCNRMDEIWTASPQMAEMIKNSGVSTLRTPIGQPIWTDEAENSIAPFALPYPKDFTFYSIFQWLDRKDPKTLLRAYYKAFEGNEQVSLILKTYRINYSESEFNLIRRDIEQWKRDLGLTNYPKVFIVRKLLTGDQMAKFHRVGDCYVTASQGEGWNRPMQEAILYAKPVISANNGGLTDIMTTSQYFVVPSSSCKATEVSYIPWYTRDMEWKKLDEDRLAEQMLNVYHHHDKAIKVGKKAQEFVVDNFSFQKIGQQMFQRLSDIYKTL